MFRRIGRPFHDRALWRHGQATDLRGRICGSGGASSCGFDTKPNTPRFPGARSRWAYGRKGAGSQGEAGGEWWMV